MSTLKRVLSLSLALVMVMSIGIFANAAYPDAEDFDPACTDAIQLLSALTIMQGYPDGSFGPAGTITRAEAAKMIYVLCNGGKDDQALAYSGLDMFYDAKTHWAANYINYCASLKIIEGRGGNRFDPDTPVTGYELAKMLLVVAGYRPDVQVYTGDRWKISVQRDSINSGLTAEYGWLMDQPAPRQWAAFMFANLILDVEEAQYIGDLLVTGSGLATISGKTVGESRLKLVTFIGTLTQTKTVNLGGGQGAYDYSVVNTVIGTGTSATNVNINVNFNVDTDFLGQQVKVVGKAANQNLTGTNRIDEKNLTTLAVYSTGLSRVYDTDIGNTWIYVDENAAGTADTLWVYIDEYNNYTDKDYKADTNVAGSNANTLLTNVYRNNYTRYAVNTSDIYEAEATVVFGRDGNDPVRAIDTDADGWIDYLFIKELNYTKVSNVSNDRLTAGNLSVLLSNCNFENGTPEINDVIAYTQVYETGGLRYDIRIIEPTVDVSVTNWTGATDNLNTAVIGGVRYYKASGSYNSANVNHKIFYIDGGYFVGSEAALGQIVTSAPEGLAVLVSMSGNPHSSDGSDNAFVASGATPSKNVNNDGTTRWGFTVQYIGIDGKRSAVKTYSFTNDGDEIGSDAGATAWKAADSTMTTWANSTRLVGADMINATSTTPEGLRNHAANYNGDKVWNSVAHYMLNPGKGNTQDVQFVEVVENADGTVTFYPVDAAGYFNVNNAVDSSASYDSKSGRLTWTGASAVNNTLITADTLVFYRYRGSGNANVYGTGNWGALADDAAPSNAFVNTGVFTMFKGSSLYSFSGADYQVEAVYNNTKSGTALAVYITSDLTSLPQADNYRFAVITGATMQSGWGHNGSTVVSTIGAIDQDGKSITLRMPANSTHPGRGKVVRYVAGSVHDNVTVVSAPGGSAPKADVVGNITEVGAVNDNTYITVAGRRFNYDENTLIFTISSGYAVTVIDTPYVTPDRRGIADVAVIAGDSDYARVIIINSSGLAVATANLAGVSAGTTFSATITGTGSDSTAGFAVPGKTLTANVNTTSAVTYAWQWNDGGTWTAVEDNAGHAVITQSYTVSTYYEGCDIRVVATVSGYTGSIISNVVPVAEHASKAPRAAAGIPVSITATFSATGAQIDGKGTFLTYNSAASNTVTVTPGGYDGTPTLYYSYYVDGTLVEITTNANRTAAQLLGADVSTTGKTFVVTAAPLGYYDNGVNDANAVKATFNGAPDINSVVTATFIAQDGKKYEGLYDIRLTFTGAGNLAAGTSVATWQYTTGAWTAAATMETGSSVAATGTIAGVITAVDSTGTPITTPTSLTGVSIRVIATHDAYNGMVVTDVITFLP